MHKRRRQAMLWAGATAVLLAAGFAPDGRCEDAGYKDFRIQDFLWTDDHDMELLLTANAETDKTGREELRLDSVNISVERDESAYATSRLAPYFDMKDVTPGHEFYLDVPLDFNYARQTSRQTMNSFYEHDRMQYEFATEQDVAMLEISPYVSYTAYFDGLFAETGTNLAYGKRRGTRLEKVDYHSPTTDWEKESQIMTSDGYAASETLRFGLGRLYNGSYAYQAMQLAEDLRQAGRLAQPLSGEDMKALAEIFARERNRYYFDSREQFILAVEKIAGFLTGKGYLAPGDIRALLVAQDVYANVSRAYRGFGETWNLIARYGVDRQSQHVELERRSDTHVTKRGMDELSESREWRAGVEFTHCEPVSREWQWEVDASVLAGQSRERREMADDHDTFTEEADRSLTVQPEVYAILQYFYNTRWTFSLSNRLQAAWSRLAESGVAMDDNPGIPSERCELGSTLFSLENALQFAANYTLHYNLAVSLNLALIYDYEKRSGYDVRGNAFGESSTLTPAEVKEGLAGLPALSTLNWQASVNVSYRLF